MSSSSSIGLAGLAALAVLGLLWLHPVSPLALSRADVALGMGRPADAARIYDAVADSTPVAAARVRALRRGAAVHASELNDAVTARKRLQRLLLEDLDARERADVHARIGALFLRERRPVRAAKALQRAVQTDPDAVDAAPRMARAARALGEAGQRAPAMEQWSQLLTEHPPWRGRANLGRAELHLASGHADLALQLFEDVTAHGTPDEQAAARLGVSICLEKLGDLDQALAAIDGAELPDGVRRSRQSALLARQAWVP